MKHLPIVLAALLAAPAVMAQTNATRADVKEETQTAVKAGEVPKGDAGISVQHPRGGAAGHVKLGQDAASAPTRAEVKGEAKAAARSGDIPKGEAEVKTKP
ncbi:MAG TPA: DUF4148 domain-containing protein [Albitalea sp.]|uniref:DUF4148 domain-containing protein n=1 Tax=Piscinibacter sp. TaxID=1903157 RepID=UPI002ED06B57